MTFSFEINQNGWELPPTLMERIKTVAQDAMAIRLSDITLQNFGDEGIDRPTDWPKLSKGYALEEHGGDQTPTLVLSGDLRSSINVELGNPEYSAVFTDNPYAAKHQYGDSENHVPPRPFFPIDSNGELTPFAQSQLVEAAEHAIAEELQ